MAKKQKEVLVQEPVQVQVKQPKTPQWEIKDRMYLLKGRGNPLTYVLQSKSTRKKPLLHYFHEFYLSLRKVSFRLEFYAERYPRLRDYFLP